MKIEFYFVPDMELQNEQTIEVLHKISNLQLDMIKCDPSMRKQHLCPFIRITDTDDTYFGQGSITRYVGRITGHQREKPSRVDLREVQASA